MSTSPERVDAAPTTRRSLGGTQVALAVAGVLVLLLVVWFLFLRGDEAPEEAVAPPPATEEVPAEEEASEAPRNNAPVETFEVFAPKDPFDPLISAAAAGTGAAATTAGPTSTPTEGSTTTAPDGTTTTTTASTSSGAGSGSSGGEDVGGHKVRTIDVFVERGSRRAQIQVDGTVYTVDEGERFATNFQLLSTSGTCATMLFGDDEFTLCEGEEILK